MSLSSVWNAETVGATWPAESTAIEVRRGVALALIIGGLLLDGMAAGLFRRRGTAVEPWKPSTVLIHEGPYRFSRNPIYLGFAITYAGLAIAMDSALATVRSLPAPGSDYLLPFGARNRFLFKMDFAEAEYIARVRSGVKGHFSYRKVAWEMKCAMERMEPELGRLLEATPPWIEDPLKR